MHQLYEVLFDYFPHSNLDEQQTWREDCHLWFCTNMRVLEFLSLKQCVAVLE